MNSPVARRRRRGRRGRHGRDNPVVRSIGSRHIAEQLEARWLLSAVSWTGAGGDALWTNPDNWSTHAVPGANDDVTISVPASPSIRITSGTQSIRSLVNDESIALNAQATLQVLMSASSSADIAVDNATIKSGTWTFAAARGFTCGAAGATLDGATINGDVFLSTQYSHVAIVGGTTFSNAHLIGFSTSIGFAPGSVLTGNVLFEGTAVTYTQYVEMDGRDGTLTIAPGGSIRTTLVQKSGAVVGGSYHYGGEMTLINDGLIAAEDAQGSIGISPTNFVNHGTVRTNPNGGGLGISPTNPYTNDGTFEMNQSGITIGGTWDIRNGLGTLIRNAGATLGIQGTLYNVGHTLTLNSDTGSWLFYGSAVLVGGELSFADGQALQPRGGLLQDVKVNGDLTCGSLIDHLQLAGTTTFQTLHLTSEAWLEIHSGYTLVDTIVFEGAQTQGYNIMLKGTQGMFTVGPTGSIRTAPDFTGTAGIGTFSQPMTLNNAGLISCDTAGGAILIGARKFNNTGTLRALAGATINVKPIDPYEPTGAYQLDDGTLNFDGTMRPTTVGSFTTSGSGSIRIVGTIDNAANNLTLDSVTNLWRLYGGTIRGGQISFADGQTLGITRIGGLIENVAIDGDLYAEAENAHVAISGSTTFANFHLIGNHSGVGLRPGYTLTGNVLFEGTGIGDRLFELDLDPEQAGVAYIAPSGSIRSMPGFAGTAFIGTGFASGAYPVWYGGDMTLNNSGLIEASGDGATVKISPSYFTNLGTFRTRAGGRLWIKPLSFWDNDGTIEVDNGTLDLDSAFDARNNGGIGHFVRTGGTVNLLRSISLHGTTITFDHNIGSWNLLGGQIGGGDIYFADGEQLILTPQGGSINDATFHSDLYLALDNARVIFSSENHFPNLHMTGNDTSVVCSSDSDGIGGNILMEGPNTGGRYVETYTSFNPSIITIAADEAIRTLPGFAGTGYIGKPFAYQGNLGLELRGVISAESSAGALILYHGAHVRSGGRTQVLNGARLYVDGGDVLIEPGGTFVASQFRTGNVVLQFRGGSAELLPDGGTSVMRHVTSAGGPINFNVNNNDVVFTYDPDPYVSLQNLVNAARNSGTWTGLGITSAVARDNPFHSTTLGMMRASDYKKIYGPNATFDGLPLTNASVVMKYTYYGDADFNGIVNFDDVTRADGGVLHHLTGWLNGDFNSDGLVNFDDYALIDLAFNTQTMPLVPPGNSPPRENFSGPRAR